MNTHEFFNAVYHQTEENERLEEYKKGLPIGKDEGGNILLAQKREKALMIRNTCVTGAEKTEFIRRLVITLSCLYERDQACFFVLSPRVEYGELLRLNSVDITVPYLRSKEDLEKSVETLKELLCIRQTGGGHPHFFLILDGLEELADTHENGELEEYRKIYELLLRKADIDVVTGVDLAKSIFAGYPSTFVGVGNCLVTTHESGKADVTYVEDDSTLSLPVLVEYPDEPTVMDSIVLLNTLSGN